MKILLILLIAFISADNPASFDPVEECETFEKHKRRFKELIVSKFGGEGSNYKIATGRPNWEFAVVYSRNEPGLDISLFFGHFRLETNKNVVLLDSSQLKEDDHLRYYNLDSFDYFFREQIIDHLKEETGSFTDSLEIHKQASFTSPIEVLYVSHITESGKYYVSVSFIGFSDDFHWLSLTEKSSPREEL